MLLQLNSVSTPSSAAVGSGDRASGPFLQPRGKVPRHRCRRSVACVADPNYLDDLLLYLSRTRLSTLTYFQFTNRQLKPSPLHFLTPDARPRPNAQASSSTAPQADKKRR